MLPAMIPLDKRKPNDKNRSVADISYPALSEAPRPATTIIHPPADPANSHGHCVNLCSPSRCFVWRVACINLPLQVWLQERFRRRSGTPHASSSAHDLEGKTCFTLNAFTRGSLQNGHLTDCFEDFVLYGFVNILFLFLGALRYSHLR
jgi:hypothetical protein